MSEIFPESPLTSLPAAVAAMGALPVPVGPEPQALSDERLAVLRKLRTHCEADRFESEDERPLHVWGPSQYPKREMCQRCTVTREWAEDADADEVVLVAEIDRLTAQRDRRRTRLVALQNDALNMRGALSPNGEARKVPFPLGPTLLPAVEWLIGRVAELEAERHETNESVSEAAEALRVQRDRIAELETGIAWRDAERDRWAGVRYLVEKAIDKGWGTVDVWELEAELGPEPAPVPAEPVAEPSCPCPPADQPGPHQVGCFFDGVPVSPPSERPVNGLTAAFAPVAALREALSREEPHDSPLHQAHRLGHDLPEGCRLSEEQVRQLGQPFLDGGSR